MRATGSPSAVSRVRPAPETGSRLCAGTRDGARLLGLALSLSLEIGMATQLPLSGPVQFIATFVAGFAGWALVGVVYLYATGRSWGTGRRGSGRPGRSVSRRRPRHVARRLRCVRDRGLALRVAGRLTRDRRGSRDRWTGVRSPARRAHPAGQRAGRGVPVPKRPPEAPDRGDLRGRSDRRRLDSVRRRPPPRLRERRSRRSRRLCCSRSSSSRSSGAGCTSEAGTSPSRRCVTDCTT